MSFIKPIPTTHTKKSQPMDLQSMFGSHSDDDDDNARNKAITVNRKTNIHYAIHRQGEKCVRISGMTV